MAAIITGSDSGIGKATAVALARRGHDIGITYSRDEDGAKATADEVRAHDRRAEVRHLDLTQTAEVQATIDELAQALGGVDILVNNAGSGASTPFLQIELAEWRDVLEVDLTGAFLAAQAAARRMVDSGTRGRIVNVTSVHEHVPLEGSTPYVVSKHGLGGLTKSMALELAEHGITVNSVAPGEIATPMTGQEDEDPRAEERPGVPVGWPGDAREVAELIAYLASPEAS
jgi:NAD(P)-dependent dehydrogenase (short-subunit alcohol dehydrogenase family)